MATLPDRRDPSVRPGRAAVLVAVAGLAGVVAAWVLAPEYLVSRGFPLDDAWIHSVYGRSLARWGMLAYNPGIPATGATSPLWAVVMAVPHLATSRPAAMLLGVKAIGLALHLLTAFLLVWAFTWRGGSASRPWWAACWWRFILTWSARA